MKRNNIFLKTALCLTIFLATSCIDHYQIKTKIFRDGSLLRTISVAGDSSSLFQGSIKVPTDSSWETSWSMEYKNPEDTSSDKNHVYTATKRFANIDSLNNFLNDERDSSKYPIITANLQKKFRWFYTYFEYAEVHEMTFPFSNYPVDSFMTDAQLGYLYDDDYTYSREYDSLVHIKHLSQIPLLTKADSIRMEELEAKILFDFAEWMARNSFEEYLKLLSILKPEIQFTLTEKEALFHNSGILYEFHLDSPFESNGDAFDSIASVFGLTADSLNLLLPKKSEIFNNQLELIFDFFDDDAIKNQLELPGLLLSCNADSITTSTAYWNYSEIFFFAKDYTLSAKSRIVNQWAFVVSGALVLVLLSLLIAGFRRR